MLPSGSQRHQMSSLMVGKAWSHVSYSWFFGLSNLRHCRVTNWNKKNFFLADILTNLRRCHLQLENLENLIFVSKNLPNDSRDGCKLPSNLVEFIQIDLGYEDKLEEFESSFERDELVDI